MKLENMKPGKQYNYSNEYIYTFETIDYKTARVKGVKLVRSLNKNHSYASLLSELVVAPCGNTPVISYIIEEQFNKFLAAVAKNY